MARDRLKMLVRYERRTTDPCIIRHSNVSPIVAPAHSDRRRRRFDRGVCRTECRADRRGRTAELPVIRALAVAIEPPRCPHLRRQLTFLVDFLLDTLCRKPGSTPQAVLKESAFALRYVLREADIIPDLIPDFGYSDDSLVVRAVLRRHRDLFREHCKLRGLRWSEITLSP